MFETADGVYIKLAQKMTYATWAASQRLVAPNDAYDDDADDDGILDIFELYFRGNIYVAVEMPVSSINIINVDGTDYLGLTARIHTDIVVCDITLTAKRSTDLQAWSPLNVILHDTEFDPVEGVEIRHYRSTIPLGSLPHEFLRLEAGELDP